MKVLIIDDSDYKVDSLTALVKEFNPSINVRVQRAYRSGVVAAREWQPDLILLDISLPTFELSSREAGGRTRAYGGRDVLGDLDSTDDFAYIIVVSQFDSFGEGHQSREELMSELHAEFPEWIVGGVYYSVVDSKWREELTELLRNVPW